jgi:HPt (histidine-containing phosphotransfer) domain-containing protein
MDQAKQVSSRRPAQRPNSQFNLDEAVARCFGRYHLFQKMVACYFDESDGLLERIRAALANNEAAELASAAHRLKGTVGYLAAQRATAAVSEVEQIGLSGDLAAAPAAIERLENELEALGPALLPHQPGREE